MGKVGRIMFEVKAISIWLKDENMVGYRYWIRDCPATTGARKCGS